jgi:hypothetical protein
MQRFRVQYLPMLATSKGDVMSVSQVASGDRNIDPMIALAGCSRQIVVAESK